MLLHCYGYSTFDTLVPHSKKNTWNLKNNQLNSGFLFFFNLLTLVYTLYNEYLAAVQPLLHFQRCSRPRITLKKTKTNRLFKTIQRGPMAQRQWSQEQIGFKIFKFLFVAYIPTPPKVLSANTSLFLIGQAGYLLYNSAFLNFFSSTLTQKIYLKLL